MKYFLSITCLFTLNLNLICQDDWMLYPSSDSTNTTKEYDTLEQALNYKLKNGNVTIYKDARIDSVQKKMSEEPFIMGWTVQILVSQQKEEIKNTKIKFLKAFPDQQLFDEYKTPNTYIYAGRFYDKISAYHFKNEISTLFDNTRVQKKMIELPLLPKRKTEEEKLKNDSENSE